MKTRLKSFWQFIRSRRTGYRIACCCCALLVTACATDSAWVGDEDMTLETSGKPRLEQVVAMQDRLDRVGGKLLIDRAGLQRGDILLRIGNKPVPQGAHAERETVELLSSLVSNNKSLRLTVLRNNRQKNMTVALTPACGFRIELGQTPNVNAYSDGNRILVTQGMMLFARSDEDLAYVISKEMAHNVLGHAKTLQNTHAATRLIDNLIRNPSYQIQGNGGLKPVPKKFDIDADTLSLAMSLRGGYAIDNATQFWKRLAYRFPATNARNYTALHPATSARLEAMPNAIVRIKAIDKRRKALATTQQ